MTEKGMLHLCYGPLIGGNAAKGSRSVLSMLVSPADAEKLFKWYERTGKATMEKRLADNPNIEYAELYGLPGATRKPTVEEYLAIEKCIGSMATIKGAPNSCPSAMLDQGNLSCHATALNNQGFQRPLATEGYVQQVQTRSVCFPSLRRR